MEIYRIEPKEQDDLREIETINALMLEISNNIRTINDCANLVVFCEKNEMRAGAMPSKDAFIFSGWKLLACRQAAISLWNIVEAVGGIKSGARKIGSLLNTFPFNDLRKAEKDLLENIPNLKHVRDAICHSAEKLKTPKRYDENKVYASAQVGGFRFTGNAEGIGQGAYFSDCYTDGKYVVSHKKKLLYFEFSDATLDIIEVFIKKIENAISPFSNLSSYDPRDAP